MKAVFKPTKKKVVIIVLVLVVIIGAVSYFNAKAKAALAAAEPMYNTAAVEKKDLKKEVSVNGTIGSVDKKSVVADISGVEVTEVNVKVGDQVKAGDVLCTFDSSSIDSKIANTKESADLAAQKSNQAVSDAQTSYNDAVTDKNTNASRDAQAVTDTFNGYQTSIAERDGANTAYQQAQADTDAKKSAYDAVLNDPNATDDQKSTALQAYQQAQIDEQAAYTTLDTAQAKVVSKEAEYQNAVQKQQDNAVNDGRTVAKQDSALDSANLTHRA